MANLVQLTDPVAVSLNTGNGIGMTAEDLRYGLASLTTSLSGSTYGSRTGVFPGSLAGGKITDLQVVSDNSMNSNVQSGNYQCYRTGKGCYVGANRGTAVVTHNTANTTNDRIDYVILRTRDPYYETTTYSAVIMIIAGNPSASPVEPSASLNDGDLLLAAVRVRANTTSILATDITDRRVFVAAKGGIRPKNTLDTLGPAHEGEYRDNLVTNALERGDENGVWTPVASPAAWTQFNATLYSGGSGACTFGSGSVLNGYYIRLGKILYLRYVFELVAPYSMGYGSITTRLPSGIVGAASGLSILPARLYMGQYAYTWQGFGYIAASSNVVRLEFPYSTTLSYMVPYVVSSSQAGVVNTGNPRVPDLGTPTSLYLEGIMEIA